MEILVMRMRKLRRYFRLGALIACLNTAPCAFALTEQDIKKLEASANPEGHAADFVEAFRSIAERESTTVQMIVTELQAQRRDFATGIAVDGDYFKLAYLLDNGWNPVLEDNSSKTLLSAAIRSRREACVDLVLKLGGKPVKVLLLNTLNDEFLADLDDHWKPYFKEKLAAWEVLTLEQSNSFFLPRSDSPYQIPAETFDPSSVLLPRAMAPGPPEAKQVDWIIVKVPYATTRSENSAYAKRLGTSKGAEKFYAYHSQGKMSYGVASVSIPRKHVRGVLENKKFWETERDPKKHVTLQKIVKHRSEREFMMDLQLRLLERENLFKDSEREVAVASRGILIYVHGFNVDFSYAMRKTGQLMFDLEYPGTSIAFSWPARAVTIPIPADFRADVKRAEDSVVHLQKFLLNVKSEFPDRPIHLLAHSLGTRALSEALANISIGRQERGLPPQKLFAEVILAAPAIDSQTFCDKWAGNIFEACERVSIFASDDDVALKVQCIAENKSFTKPVGLWSEAGVCLPRGFLGFDLSNLSGGTFSLEHSLYSEVPTAIDQLSLMLNLRLGSDKFINGKYSFLAETGGTHIWFPKKALAKTSGFKDDGSRRYWKFLRY